MFIRNWTSKWLFWKFLVLPGLIWSFGITDYTGWVFDLFLYFNCRFLWSKGSLFSFTMFSTSSQFEKIQAVKNPWRTSIFSYILQTIWSNKMNIRLHLFIHVTNILRTLNWKKKIQYLSYGYHLLWTRLKFKTSNSLLQLQIIS